MSVLTFILAAAGTVLYHCAQRLTARDLDAGVSLVVTYATALALSGLFVIIRAGGGAAPTSVATTAPSVVTGLAIFLVELGFLLAYRFEWRINVLALSVSIVVAMALVPIGYFGFGESLTRRDAGGLILCLIGLALLSHRGV